ncbi:PEP-CTERM sorting domain-containing protein [Merismopedia glauca]|uniref:Ice-binding protein C-terminal domain-containing protein n=1 Tax=Merismopedia glauca CCAP 1448/3 TaxID=1296344 RepID=A0A2T1C8D9_9CYAN|nr:PEP-CTERM sorting domain-containing protein [Merismopedia glauca]PSB04542.1 hypothetical protein C7B64_03740 [Merismopedia glauca CCAP 1448/3]
MQLVQKIGIFSGAFLAFLVSGNVAKAANLSFTPPGTQLDGDPILDIKVARGGTLAFDVVLNTAGVDVGANTLKDIQYVVRWDPTELSLALPTVDVADNFRLEGIITASNRAVVQHVGARQPLGNNFILDRLIFNVVNPGTEPHDGRFDFKIETVRAINQTGGNVSGLFTFGSDNNPLFQQVEVQVPEPSSILGLLAFGTLGAGSFWKRQQKRVTRNLAKVTK